ncbi:hypothetical protein ACFFGV_07880 [Pontibacillus salicampi]|uniref:Uncharacterized protein n=1 Tax=Pontibacillus salicampi TaxID=1449801 RepID=A0ABV6LMH3_9BACI
MAYPIVVKEASATERNIPVRMEIFLYIHPIKGLRGIRINRLMG